MIATEKVLNADGIEIAEIFPVGVIGYDEDVWAYRLIAPGEELGVVVNTELRDRERAITVIRNIAQVFGIARAYGEEDSAGGEEK